MLIKCVCSNCGHSYLSDDGSGDVACPRCEVANEGPRNPSDIPAAPRGIEREFMERTHAEDSQEALFDEGPLRFEAQAPPPMFITRKRLIRGIIFGALAAGTFAAVLGAAMAAIRIDVPAASAAIIALIGGAACRSGFGGRSADRTKTRAVVACAIIVVFGFAGFIAGTWGVERLTGSRASQAQADLEDGLKELAAQYEDTQDAGAAIVLKQRIEDTRRLHALSDPQIEDYLWIQQARINQPLLAHAKLRMTFSPIIKMGPDAATVSVPMGATLAIRLAEIIAAILLASRAVMPNRR